MDEFQSFDIRGYLDWIGTPYWEAGPNVAHGWIGIQCLSCDDGHNHLGIALDRKNYSCWKCKARGNLVDLICELEDCNLREARERIEEFQGDFTEAQERPRLEDEGQDILPKSASKKFPTGHLSFIRKRRYDPDVLIPEWDLFSGGMLGRWKGRIIVPVKLDGRIVTWIGMAASASRSPKYLAAPVEQSIIPASETIYGGDYVRDVAVVVEGVTDTWRIGKGAVATLGMGAAAMDAKLARLANLPASRYFIIFDAEDDAQMNAERLGRELKVCGKEVEIIELDAGDPDDLSDDEANDLRKELGL